MRDFPWLGLLLVLFVGWSVIFGGCDVNHNISGDAYVHVITEGECDMLESSGGIQVTCFDDRQLACLETEVAGNYLCRLIQP